MPAFDTYPARETTTPFYSGYRAGLKFNNVFMTADSWSADISNEPIELTTVQLYRSSNLTNLATGYPAWDNHGTPAAYVQGGIRETEIKIHGFHKDNNLPKIGQDVSIVLMIGNDVFFQSNRAIVTKCTFSVSVKGTIEYNIDLKGNPSSNISDTDIHPRF